ncbi:MAG: DUF4870 domain-containing protein [Candidatus Obscuribacterales bacterium]|nr:DUF4870 domain-containing protein [Candidatus Obscuribacterales bacterium]
MNEKWLSVASHASVLCTSVFGVFAIPLLILLFGPSELVKQNAREALNAHINVLLVSLLFAIFISLAALIICAVALPAGIQIDSWGNQINDSIRIVNGLGAMGVVLGAMVVCTVLIALVYALWFAVYAFVMPVIAVCVVANDSNRVFCYPLLISFLCDRRKDRIL